MGEYIAHINEEVKHRPLYLISDVRGLAITADAPDSSQAWAFRADGMSAHFDKYRDSYRAEVEKSFSFIGQDLGFFTRVETRPGGGSSPARRPEEAVACP